MSNVERVEYTPVSVRETLIQMKDISELMIDLAYSAALFNNAGLAEEVMELEKRMDTLVYILNMNLMLAARDKEDAESLAGVAKVGSLTNSIHFKVLLAGKVHKVIDPFLAILSPTPDS